VREIKSLSQGQLQTSFNGSEWHTSLPSLENRLVHPLNVTTGAGPPSGILPPTKKSPTSACTGKDNKDSSQKLQ
jgi:hypothetical protein